MRDFPAREDSAVFLMRGEPRPRVGDGLVALTPAPLSLSRERLENGCIESFNARLRDELLNGELFCTLKEAQVLIEAWRRHYNAIRPHGSLGHRPPTPETIVTPGWPPGSAPPAGQLGGETTDALTFKLDQSVGAGQAFRVQWPADDTTVTVKLYNSLR